jgi:small-conductance mechanosensitive channel
MGKRLALLALLWLPVAALAAENGAEGQDPGPAMIRVGERGVVPLQAGRNGRTAQARASEASAALLAAVDSSEPIRVEEQPDASVIFVGKVPILEVGDEDASGETRAVRAAAIATKLGEVLKAERQRRSIQDLVFSVSLVVFASLLAFLGIRKLRSNEEQLRRWLELNSDRLPALHLGPVEVANQAAVQGALGWGLRIGNLLTQLLIGYLWLLFSLARFPRSRELGERLTGFILSPAATLLARLGGLVPLFLLVAGVTLVVLFLMRTIRLFFGAVARGELILRSVPPELASPVSVLVRGGLVLAALLFAIPVVTGSDDGGFGRITAGLLSAVALGAAPLFATGLVGIATVFGGGLRVGDSAEVAGRSGRVTSITLLHVELEDGEGARVQVPHLVGLFSPMRVTSVPLASIDISVDPEADPTLVEELLLQAAGSRASGARVQLLTLSSDAAVWRVTGLEDNLGPKLALALRTARIGLGQRSSVAS